MSHPNQKNSVQLPLTLIRALLAELKRQLGTAPLVALIVSDTEPKKSKAEAKAKPTPAKKPDQPQPAEKPAKLDKPQSTSKKPPTNKPDPKKVQAIEADPLRQTILEEIRKRGPLYAKRFYHLFQAEKDPAESTRLFLKEMVKHGLIVSFGRGTGTTYGLKP